MRDQPEMTIERKAELFDRDRQHAERLNQQAFQIFRINENGRWVQVLASYCAPSVEGESAGEFFAIIEGKPYPISVESDGTSFAPFPGEDGDGETIHHFNLIANNLKVGECSYREY